jgi:hypothetical protein
MEVSANARSDIKDILHRFGLENSFPMGRPMDHNIQLDNLQCKDTRVNRLKYMSIIGSLMYAAQGTWPDIAFTVTSLSRYSSCPLQRHRIAALRVVKYLNCTSLYRLCYRPSSGMNTVHAFTDSDWAGCKSPRKSIGGFQQFHGPDEMIRSEHSMALISWSSKQQTMVTLSTLEAEFIACSNAMREVVLLRSLLESIQVNVLPTPQSTWTTKRH